MATLTVRPTLKQHEVYQALKDKSVDTVFFGGGAGGGKSWLICESRLVNALLHPGYKSYIGREELKRLMQSTYVTWCKVCQFHKVPPTQWKLNGQYNYIEFDNGSRIDLLDLKYLPTDPMYERFGSLEYTDGAIEEAGEVDFLAYDVLKSRHGRHKNAEFGLPPVSLVTGNPKKNWTYREFYAPWKNGTLAPSLRFIQALYTDNPYTAGEYGKQLASMKDKMLRERLMLGNWDYDDDPTALMQFDAIADVFTNTAEPSEQKYLTADVARFGKDKTVITLWKGLHAYRMKAYSHQGIDETAQIIKDLTRSEGIPYSHVIVDEDGVGGGVVDILRGIKGFVANRTPVDNKKTGKPENYGSLKAQCCYVLADKINSRQLAVTIEDQDVRDMLTEELQMIRAKEPDSDKKLRVVSKDQTIEHLGRSPDYADTLMMRMYFELVNPFAERTMTSDERAEREFRAMIKAKRQHNRMFSMA